MDALCFTVEIDINHFPHIDSFINELEHNDILYISNSINCQKDNHRTFLFQFDDNEICRLSSMLTELVKFDFLKDYAKKLIQTNYVGISPAEEKELIANILNEFNTKEISAQIYKFISENMHIHLSGFVLFRLKKYISDFEDEVDFAVDEFMLKKRYEDFVEFLRFFVDMQTHEIDKVNVVLSRFGDYEMLDKNGKKISKELLDSTYCEISLLEDSGYLMLNDIISLAPKNVVIHLNGCKNDEFVKLVREIYGGRVAVCYGCNLCRGYLIN